MQVLIGNRLWITTNGIGIDEELEQKITSYELRGDTVVLTSIAGMSYRIVTETNTTLMRFTYIQKQLQNFIQNASKRDEEA